MNIHHRKNGQYFAVKECILDDFHPLLYPNLIFVLSYQYYQLSYFIQAD